MEEHAKKIAEMLKVLANESRLLILCELLKEPKTVSALAEKVTHITQSALSQHLALMKAHGLLDSAKAGQHITYWIADDRLEKVLEVLKTHYCPPEVP